jgi:hypothetical protein
MLLGLTATACGKEGQPIPTAVPAKRIPESTPTAVRSVPTYDSAAQIPQPRPPLAFGSPVTFEGGGLSLGMKGITIAIEPATMKQAIGVLRPKSEPILRPEFVFLTGKLGQDRYPGTVVSAASQYSELRSLYNHEVRDQDQLQVMPLRREINLDVLLVGIIRELRGDNPVSMRGPSGFLIGRYLNYAILESWEAAIKRDFPDQATTKSLFPDILQRGTSFQVQSIDDAILEALQRITH